MEKSKIIMLVEGESDLIFLRDIILLNYKKQITEDSSKVKNKRINEFQFETSTKIIDLKVCNEAENINSVGGWTNLKNLIQILESQNYSKYLFLFDADNSKEENIDFKQNKIKEWVSEKFSFDTFFFPHNNELEDDLEDDLEDLIIKSIQPKYICFFHCWDGFETCLDGKFSREQIQYPDKKRKLFAFKDSFIKKDAMIFKNYNSTEIWNIDFEKNEHLSPLKEFLDQHIKTCVNEKCIF